MSAPTKLPAAGNEQGASAAVAAPAKPAFRWLPAPLMSLTLLGVWLLLNQSVSVGHITLGALLGWRCPGSASGCGRKRRARSAR
jgi:hypothetical protein